MKAKASLSYLAYFWYSI